MQKRQNTLDTLQAKEARALAELNATKKALQVAQAKRRAEERKQDAIRWQRLGKLIESSRLGWLSPFSLDRLGTLVTDFCARLPPPRSETQLLGFLEHLFSFATPALRELGVEPLDPPRAATHQTGSSLEPLPQHTTDAEAVAPHDAGPERC